jgi:hypothetical protein
VEQNKKIAKSMIIFQDFPLKTTMHPSRREAQLMPFIFLPLDFLCPKGINLDNGRRWFRSFQNTLHYYIYDPSTALQKL